MDDLFLPNIAIAGGGAIRACRTLGIEHEVVHVPHHQSHAAFACYSSPYDEAACLVMDGYGEESAQSVFLYQDNQLTPVDLPPYQGAYNRLAASLGVYYGVTVCRLCGFATDSGEEWKIMGLAPYGKLNPALLEVLKRHIRVDEGQVILPDGSGQALAQMSEFARPYHQFPEECADLAYTCQYYFGELMTEVLGWIAQVTGQTNLVLTGGCALNSSFNGLISQKTPFKSVFVPSAPGDDGNAAGAALAALKAQTGRTIRNAWQTPYLGDAISDAQVQDVLARQVIHKAETFEGQALYDHVAQLIDEGKVIAWVQGRAEYGPRALGNRSILADPRSFEMKATINAAVKFREPFRPFAPMVLDEFGADYFEHYSDTPYMEKVLSFKESVRQGLAAVCHQDGTGRLQSVTRERNEPIYELMQAFYQRTGTPVLLNTSLNVMGKPMVSSLSDVLNTFMTTDIDILVIGQRVFYK